jgi:hypothetical protein
LEIQRDTKGQYKRDDKGRYMYVDGGYEGAQEKLKKAEFTSRYKKPDGEYLIEFEDVVKYIKDLNDKVKKAYSEAQQKYNEAKEHNAKIQASPKPFEATRELLNEKYIEKDKLQNQIKQQRHDIAAKEELKKKLLDVTNEIKMLNAKLNASHDYGFDEGFVQELAEAEQFRDDLIRQSERRKKGEQRINDIIDKRDDIEFNNNVNRKRLEDSPTSKKAREEAQDEAIKAKIQAERQRELHESMEMTHKAEQEKRMLEMKENAAQSEKVQELDEKIVAERARGRVAEDEKQRLERLAEVRKNTRDKIIARDAQRKLNEHKRTQSGSAIDDATTTLVVMGNELDRQAAEDDKFKAELKPLVERFERYPAQFNAFNEVIRTEQFNGFDTIEDLQDGINTKENLQALKDFFTAFDRGEIVIQKDDESNDDESSDVDFLA